MSTFFDFIEKFFARQKSCTTVYDFSKKFIRLKIETLRLVEPFMSTFSALAEIIQKSAALWRFSLKIFENFQKSFNGKSPNLTSKFSADF